MELLLLNEKFELLSHPIDRYYSLIWRERYYDEGDFELHLAADYLETVLRSEYLYNNERDEAMVIEGVEAQDDGKRTIKITGRSLESLFRDRVMDAEGSSSGKVEEISRSAVQTYAMTGSRAIPLLKLGALGGFTETAAASNKRGAELYEWQRELLRPYEMSFRLHYDYEANSLDYTVYRGLDRTQEQTANNWAIFSTSYENLAQFAYSRSKTDYRNFAIVISSDGTKRVEVDKTGGAKRRELYVDTDDGLDTAAMTQLGEQALTEYAMVETVSGEVQNGANMVYGVDFDLGDLCHIEDAHLGISATARLTEMTTVVENGVTRRIPAFGEQYLNLRQYVAREVGASGTSAGSSSGGGGVVDLTGIEQAIAANAAAIEAANDEIEAVQAAAYDNAADIVRINSNILTIESRLSKLEVNKIDEYTVLLLHGSDITDSSALKRTINNYGVTVSSAQSKFGGKSLYFDGSAYLTTTAIEFNDSDFTIDWWEYVTNTNSQVRFSSAYDPMLGMIGGFMLGHNQTILRASTVDSSTWWNMANDVNIVSNNLNTWVHWAIVRSGNILNSYKNGVKYASTPFVGSLGYTTNYPCAIGSYCASDRAYFIGYIDEFRISNIARWLGNFTPPTTEY
jgi:hypothetical protein